MMLSWSSPAPFPVSICGQDLQFLFIESKIPGILFRVQSTFSDKPVYCQTRSRQSEPVDSFLHEACYSKCKTVKGSSHVSNLKIESICISVVWEKTLPKANKRGKNEFIDLFSAFKIL